MTAITTSRPAAGASLKRAIIRTRGSILIAMLVQAAGLELPRTGLAGFLSSTTWNNTIGYALVALLLIALTRGRLGARAASSEADSDANG